MSKVTPIRKGLSLAEIRTELAKPEYKSLAVQQREVWCELRLVYESMAYVITEVRVDDGRLVMQIEEAHI